MPIPSSWTIPYTNTSPSFYPANISFANGLFIVGGSPGVILTSPNGTTWTQQSSGTAARLNDAAFGKNTWVVVGSCGTIRTSIDNGVTWSANASGTFNTLYTVTFGNNTFLAAGQGGWMVQSN